MDENYWTKELEKEEKLRWRHEKHDSRVSVSRFEDGTWDTHHEDRLIENYDTREEAVSRAREIMGSAGEDDKKSGFGRA